MTAFFLFLLLGLTPSVSQSIFELSLDPTLGAYFNTLQSGNFRLQFPPEPVLSDFAMGPVDVSSFYTTPFRAVTLNPAEIELEPQYFNGDKPFTLLFSERGRGDFSHVGFAFGRRIGDILSFVITADYTKPWVYGRGTEISQVTLAPSFTLGNGELRCFLLKNKTSESDIRLMNLMSRQGRFCFFLNVISDKVADWNRKAAKAEYNLSDHIRLCGGLNVDSRNTQRERRGSGSVVFSLGGDRILEIGGVLSEKAFMPLFKAYFEKKALYAAFSVKPRYFYPLYTDSAVTPMRETRFTATYKPFSFAAVSLYFVDFHRMSHGSSPDSSEILNEGRFVRGCLMCNSPKFFDLIKLSGKFAFTPYTTEPSILRKWDVKAGIEADRAIADSMETFGLGAYIALCLANGDPTKERMGIIVDATVGLFKSVRIEFKYRYFGHLPWIYYPAEPAAINEPCVYREKLPTGFYYSLGISALLWD